MATKDYIPPELENDPTYRKYFLKAKTKFIKKDVLEELKDRTLRYTRQLVILVLEESDQRTRFLSAWMPDTVNEWFEVVADVGAPIHAPVRMSVHRGHDEKSEKPYLFVMSKGAEDIFLRFPEGTSVLFTVLPANLDSEADHAPDAMEGNFDVIEER